jgi:hypothetical protein
VTEVDPNNLSDDQIDVVDRMVLTAHSAERAAAISDYRTRLSPSYTTEEQTLLLIGFTDGWNHLDRALQRLLTALPVDHGCDHEWRCTQCGGFAEPDENRA